MCCLSLPRLGEIEVAPLTGSRGSFASSLDYAITKQVLWIQDMFGMDGRGMSVAGRVFVRTNPNLKRAGPVMVAINRNFLPVSSLEIEIDGDRQPSRDRLEKLLDKIEGRSLDCRNVNQKFVEAVAG